MAENMNDNKNQSEVEKFFNGLPSEENQAAQIFDEPKKPEPAKVKDEGGEDDVTIRKNRHHRRIEDQLQRERESNIALNERLKVYTESERYARDHGGEVDPRLARIFGTDTEDKKELIRLFTDMRKEDRELAKKEALAEIESRQAKAREEQKQFESFIDTELESLEEAHSVDLTSDAPAARKSRREFLELVQNLSPKDQDGTITGYADFDTAFALYQRTKTEQKPSETVQKQKEVASRSMQRPGGGSSETTPKSTPGFFGWKKDLNIR